MTVHHLDLADYLAIAAEVTQLDVETLAAAANLHLADSALQAANARFGDTELYPDFIDKAAVLIVRLTKNHPLPDRNERAAWVSLRVFIEVNDWCWTRYPSVDEAEEVVFAIASGERDEQSVASWLRTRIAMSVGD